MDRMPLWPPAPPFSRRRITPKEYRVHIGHQGVCRRDLVEVCQRADSLAAEVHERLRFGEDDRPAGDGRPTPTMALFCTRF